MELLTKPPPTNSSIVNSVPYDEYIGVPVTLPHLQKVFVKVQVPWYTRGNVISTVLFPILKEQEITVQIPCYDATGDIIICTETWIEETIVYRRAHIRGILKYYATETWVEKRVTYLPKQLFKKITTWETQITFPGPRISGWERVAMTILGGSYEDVQEVSQKIANQNGSTNESTVRSGLKAEHKGIGGLLPALIKDVKIAPTK